MRDPRSVPRQQVTGHLDNRVSVLAAGLTNVRRRLAAACQAAGRSPDEVTLVAVTKTYPAADALRLVDLGVTDLGENRDQEAAAKASELAAAGAAATWHYVGRLQRNKCRSVVGYADVVHSVDSVRLAEALAGAAQRGRSVPLDVLVQLSIDGDLQRGGALPGDGGEPDVRLDRVLAAVAGAATLRLRGIMAVAPLGWDAREAFTRVAEAAARVRREYPQAQWVSAGMSNDLEVAIECGSTHVRVGNALLGKRAASPVA